MFYINNLYRSTSMREPSRGDEKRTAVWASHPEERGRDDVAAPPVCAPRGVPHCWVVLDRCNPVGSAADAGPEAAARGEGLRVRRMTGSTDGMVDVPQALHGSPSTSPIPAQRVAGLDRDLARNCLPPLKLHRKIQ